MRTDLSPSTWIEDSYIYTRSVEVAAAWAEASECVSDETYRIPLTAAREVYRYREGEPWCGKHENHDDGSIETHAPEKGPGWAFPWYKEVHSPLHLRAVIACGGSADSLRALAGALEDV